MNHSPDAEKPAVTATLPENRKKRTSKKSRNQNLFP